MSRATLYAGDALTVLKTLPDESVQCCVTSPPYWGLRDYGSEGQYGLEKTPDEYVSKMVGVFREVRRVLRDDGTLWLNVGDSYASSPSGGDGRRSSTLQGGKDSQEHFRLSTEHRRTPEGLKPKDLVGIPWLLAFALRADGWYLRSDIIWSKPNPMPESVTDRPTKAHEYLFLLSKESRYYYDADAIAEPLTESSIARLSQSGLSDQAGSDRVPGKTNGNMKAVSKYKHDGGGLIEQRHRTKDGISGDKFLASLTVSVEKGTRNARTVWEIATQPYSGAHFATFPPELARRCILAGSKPTDTILDPFGGSGTVASVATGHGRNAIHIDLRYHELAVDRIGPLVCDMVAA